MFKNSFLQNQQLAFSYQDLSRQMSSCVLFMKITLCSALLITSELSLVGNAKIWYLEELLSAIPAHTSTKVQS